MTPESRVIEQLFSVIDKESQDVPFKLNSAQRYLDEHWTGRDVVPKARQEGVSTWVLARLTVMCLGHHNVRAVVISHEREATERMLEKVNYFLKKLKTPPPVMRNESKSELRFAKTNSTFYIGTAGAKAFGRGDTITHLHCSEVAYWDDPKKLITGLFNAVPQTGEIAIESTGNGKGNWYHRLCMRAYEGKSRYKLHFLPWHTFEEYTHRLDIDGEHEVLESLVEDWEEPELVEKHHLTPGQISWRREKLEELDYDLLSFKQEYPMTLDECFQATGASFFLTVNYEETALWRRRENDFFALDEHPRVGCQYSIGSDVSAGVGSDYSVACVFDLVTGEQVAELRSNVVDPSVWGVKLAALGKAFNMAYLTVESNNHGILTLKTVQDLYPYNLIHSTPNAARARADEVGKLSDLGVRTTVRSKPYVLGKFRREVKQNLTIHSPVLKSEMDTFVEHETGKLAGQDGCNDDCVIAAALAAFTFERAIVATEPPAPSIMLVKDPFDMDSIIRELRGRKSTGFPITPQVDWM